MVQVSVGVVDRELHWIRVIHSFLLGRMAGYAAWCRGDREQEQRHHASIAWTCWKPNRLAPTPRRMTSVSRPYAAPTDSRLSRIETAATTIDRNAVVSRRKLRPKTSAST